MPSRDKLAGAWTDYEQGQYDTFGHAGLAGEAPVNLEYERPVKNRVGRTDNKEEIRNHLPSND